MRVKCEVYVINIEIHEYELPEDYNMDDFTSDVLCYDLEDYLVNQYIKDKDVARDDVFIKDK